MISLLSKRIALFLCKKEIIDDEKKSICEYGFELIISIFIGFLLVIISGILLDEFLASLIFYILFVFVRTFTGGFHAKTHFYCKLTMFLCCLFVIIGTKLLNGQPSLIIFNFLFLMVYIVSVFLYAPVEHENAPMTNELKKRNRKISIIMAIALSFLIGMVMFCVPKIAVISSLTLFVIAVLIIIPNIKERSNRHYEKSNGKGS